MTFDENKYIPDSFSDSEPVDNAVDNPYSEKNFWGYPTSNRISNKDTFRNNYLFKCGKQIEDKLRKGKNKTRKQK